ncbi:SdrD B-like domain-containing protein [Amycolatopsis sp. BJA-103]|uniref:SdrD B-like domain-containing protein n=1 Tax=Amycolatopsis sp. BJA-103 TaxID=1911175 RepID=UPI000CA23699|nr:SdrD B-like domain-containing protein [Amycolatopsis sp. BJA-103]AUI63195.1 hypothetical protein BKN51_36970 [Amycolatopsis sp. BJA-103]PNE19039.1 hypothetical protein B1H26_14675 [Amycolatopsis sp. BJA-103]
MRRTLSGRSVRALGALTVAFTLTGTLAAAPAFAEPGPNLKITAVATEGRWLRGDTIPIDLRVTNAGDAPATDVRAQADLLSGPYFSFDWDSWGDLRFDGPGTSVQPGESRTYRLTGRVWVTDAGNPLVRISVQAAADTDLADNTVDVPVALVPLDTTERVAGQVYGDGNGDGVAGPGEGFAGITVRVESFDMPNELVTVTDPDGRFSFDAVPVGPARSLRIQDGPSGWFLPSLQMLRLDGGGGNQAVSIRGVRPLTESLRANIELDKATYAIGETATATVTVTNKGTRPLSGLYATCDDPRGLGNNLEIPQDQWGAFGPSRSGALAVGESKVFTFSGKVPDNAIDFGRTFLECEFSGTTELSGPRVSAEGKVPGKRGDIHGQAWVDRNENGSLDAGEGLADTTVALHTFTADEQLVSVAQTDANGFATFTDVPVGEYLLRPAAPWRAAGDPAVHHYAPPYDTAYRIKVTSG